MAKRGTAATDPPHFRVSPEVLGPLGTEQLQDPALAVLELIKNSWDADAKRVTVEVRTKGNRKISVEDNGAGMSSRDFTNRWLVIGSSYKRTEKITPGGRPYIGEKGLGRLATFALGRVIKIDSVQGAEAFSAEVDWGALRRAPSLEEYPIKMGASNRRRGTRIEIRDLNQEWTTKHTDFLISHAEFLTAIPGTGFHTTISIDSHKQILGRSQDQISRLAEATFEMEVEADGTPKVTCCIVNGVDWTGRIDYRALHPKHIDKRLAGVKLSMMFFRRDDLEKRLGSRGQSLQRNFVKNVLERYQGIRIYRDGINVPPYGINADDWASLERQRTRTGGPTMVPGNTQLIGELHVSRDKQSHLVVTAGKGRAEDERDVPSRGRLRALPSRRERQ